MSCQVKVAQGILEGKECVTFYGKKYYSFEGIPYAKPPVGKLRFKAPEEPEPWSGVRDAKKPGNKCVQLNPYLNSSIEGSEDCLYLNVYTPSLPGEKIEKLPVIIFIHGGRLIFGYGDYYKPDYLLKNDVILVTINYRLHILGFLCLNIPEVPGNAALKDSIMALKWVNKNIGFFNGDPNNVTAMGESAGAGIAGSLLTSKMSDGLFSKVICQSGVPISDLYMVEGEDPIEKAKLVASNLGKQLTDERSLYEFLLDVPIEELLIAFSSAELSRPPAVLNAIFLPVIEKKFDNVERYFDEYPRIDVARNRFRKVPVIIGMNSHEAAQFLRRDSDGKIQYEEDFFYFIPRYLHLKQGDEKAVEIERKFRQYYFNNREVNDKTLMEYLYLICDRYFNFDLIQGIEMVSKFSSDAYFYKCQYSGNMHTRVLKSLGIQGASHGDMIQYQFYRQSKHDKCTKSDEKMVDILSELWCNFAKYGKPSSSNLSTKWLPYTPTNKNTLLINNENDIQLVKNPEVDRHKFWLSLIGETSKL